MAAFSALPDDALQHAAIVLGLLAHSYTCQPAGLRHRHRPSPIPGRGLSPAGAGRWEPVTRDADEAIEPQTRRELIPIVRQIPDLVETWLRLVAD